MHTDTIIGKKLRIFPDIIPYINNNRFRSIVAITLDIRVCYKIFFPDLLYFFKVWHCYLGRIIRHTAIALSRVGHQPDKDRISTSCKQNTKQQRKGNLALFTTANIHNSFLVVSFFCRTTVS